MVRPIAMPPKFADNLESATADFAFDGAANIFGAIACARAATSAWPKARSAQRASSRDNLAGWRNFYGEGRSLCDSRPFSAVRSSFTRVAGPE